MSNPLVAPTVDSTTAISGIGLLESASDLRSGIESGSWVEGGLGGLGVGLEVLGLAIDPFGTLAGYAIGWLIEHLDPLSDALDSLAGSPDVIAAYAQTWGNVNQAVASAADDLERALNDSVSTWVGQGADAYRRTSLDQVASLRAAAEQATSVGSAVELVGTLVGAVREIVRDLIADCVATLLVRIPQWVAEIGATLGIATPHVVSSAVVLISRWVDNIADVLLKLTRSIDNLIPLLRNVRGIWDDLGSGFRAAPSTSPIPSPPASAVPSVPTPATPDVPGTSTPSAGAPSTPDGGGGPPTTPDAPAPASTTPGGQTPAAVSSAGAAPTMPATPSPAATPGFTLPPSTPGAPDVPATPTPGTGGGGAGAPTTPTAPASPGAPPPPPQAYPPLPAASLVDPATGSPVLTKQLLHPGEPPALAQDVTDAWDRRLQAAQLVDPSATLESIRTDLAVQNPGLDASSPVVQAQLSGYDRTGGLGSDQAWDGQYLRSNTPLPRGGRDLVWPDPASHPQGFSGPLDRTAVVLQQGQVFDRYGPPFGNFGSPEGTLYALRGLPPDNLATGYHRYEVLQPVPAWQGAIAPAMGQPGGGTQWYTTQSVVDLIAAGYLRELP